MLSAVVLSFVISDLHHLFHKCSHLFRRFILCLPCGVGVSAEGEPGVVVYQHGGYCFYVYAVLQSHGYEGMPKLVEAENEAILVEVENGT